MVVWSVERSVYTSRVKSDVSMLFGNWSRPALLALLISQFEVRGRWRSPPFLESPSLLLPRCEIPCMSYVGNKKKRSNSNDNNGNKVDCSVCFLPSPLPPADTLFPCLISLMFGRWCISTELWWWSQGVGIFPLREDDADDDATQRSCWWSKVT